LPLLDAEVVIRSEPQIGQEAGIEEQLQKLRFVELRQIDHQLLIEQPVGALAIAGDRAAGELIAALRFGQLQGGGHIGQRHPGQDRLIVDAVLPCLQCGGLLDDLPALLGIESGLDAGELCGHCLFAALRQFGVGRQGQVDTVEVVEQQAAHQLLDVVGILDMAAQVLPDAPVMLFFEEPGLSNSMHPTFPMSPAAIDRLVGGVVEAIAERAFVGIQVSGRADWGLLVRTGIRVLGAPISARLDSAAADLQRFFDEGGFIAWGAVPVDEPLGPNSDRLWRRLSEIWAELAMAGLDPLQLRERSIITPAANLHAFGASQTERVLRLTNELSQRVFHQVTGARFAVGA